jgi:hypothetical protein
MAKDAAGFKPKNPVFQYAPGRYYMVIDNQANAQVQGNPGAHQIAYFKLIFIHLGYPT